MALRSRREKAEKLVYTIEEVSRLVQMDIPAIENWEKEFPFLPSGITSEGEKIFRKKEVLILKRLRKLIDDEGFTLSGARRQVEEEFDIRPTSIPASDLMKRSLFQIREKLKDLSESLNKK